jgi:hypothetical protein
MKRIILFFVMMVAIAGLITMQSCKEDPIVPASYEAAMPAVPVPAVDAVIPFTGAGQTVNLSWTGTATNTPKWDVYFGDSDSPDKVASAVSTPAYTATIDVGGTYFWQVITKDAITGQGVVTKSPVWSFVVNSEPDAPITPSPALDETDVSCTATLTWVGSDPESDDLTYDLFLGTTADPAPFAAGLTDASYTITTALSPFTLYYWKVVAHDPYGGNTTGAVWKFTTGALPINTFTGLYLCDEPAEAYSYDVTFAATSTKVTKTTNYWNSGWTGNFTLDFTNLTYNMPFTTFATNWTGVEQGIIDPATGKMEGTYTIWYKGAIAEQGVHTYTKK